jgi:hypothetical protein
MKFVILIITLIFSLNSFSQSRKTLLKEIKVFEKETYFNAQYSATTDEIKLAATTYFTYYKLYQQDSVSIILTKVQDLYAKYDRRQSKHFVTALIEEKNGLKTVALSDKTEDYTQPFTHYEPNKNRGGFKLNRLEFYRFLYHYFNKDPLTLPTELSKKVATYNSKQTKEEKKIIAGRDY